MDVPTVYGSDNNDKLINENSSNKIDVSSNGLLQYDGIESSYILTHKTKCTRQRFENQEPLTVTKFHDMATVTFNGITPCFVPVTRAATTEQINKAKQVIKNLTSRFDSLHFENPCKFLISVSRHSGHQFLSYLCYY